jgi:hypothetical protein
VVNIESGGTAFLQTFTAAKDWQIGKAVNQWVMRKDIPGKANIHYGKLLLVNSSLMP